MKSIILLVLLFAQLSTPKIVVKESGYSMTRADLSRFLRYDQTDKNVYVDGVFTCVQFSQLLIQRARGIGFAAVPIVVSWKHDPNTHEFVAFAVNDVPGGVVFIEPINDAPYWYDDKNDKLCYVGGDCWPDEVASFEYSFN